VVPLQFAIYDEVTGTERNEIIIEKGTPIYVGIGALNHSPAIWGEDAAEFRADRWINAGTGVSVVAEGSAGVKTPGVFSQTCVSQRMR
jgi:cytochrome P450